MAKFKVTIDSVMGGMATRVYGGRAGQFHASLNIDPDIGLAGAIGSKTSGALVPVAYDDFTSTLLNSTPMWLITNPKNERLYAYLTGGRVVSYSNGFIDETDVTATTAITNGNGSGAVYYNNYIYFATTTNISRYGPLDGSPAIVNTVWTGSTLGTQTALTDTTYPSQVSVEYPNHPMHKHLDGVYFGDFINGRGLIHFIRTKKTTAEGDTNDGSSYNVLDLDFGYAPIDIESYGNDLAVLAVELGSTTTLKAGAPMLYLWDTVSSTWYRQIPIPDPFASALLNINGRLIVFSGNLNSGVRVSEYLGGYSFRTLNFTDLSFCPFSSAVDGWGNRIVFGGNSAYPVNSTCAWAIGYKDDPTPALHNIAEVSAVASTSSGVTCLKHVEHANFVTPRPVIGWKDVDNYGIDNYGSTTNSAYFRTLHYRPGAPFVIKELVIPLAITISAARTITATFYIDDNSTTKAMTTINNTNYSGKRRIVFNPVIYGYNNFMLELKWTGTDAIPVTLPIIIKGETMKERIG